MALRNGGQSFFRKGSRPVHKCSHITGRLLQKGSGCFNRVEGIFSPLPHHRTCRSAYGGSVLYLVLLQRFCSLLSNLRLPAFCLIYVSATLRIGSEQNIFYMRFWTVQPFPNLHLVLWLLLTSHSSLLLQISLSVRPHGINQYSFLVYLPDLRIKVTVTFWTSLNFDNLSA